MSSNVHLKNYITIEISKHLKFEKVLFVKFKFIIICPKVVYTLFFLRGIEISDEKFVQRHNFHFLGIRFCLIFENVFVICSFSNTTYILIPLKYAMC